MSGFNFAATPVVVNGTTHYPFSSNSSNWRADAKMKCGMNAASAPAYPQTEGYGKSTDGSVRKQLCLHELRNVMPYLDINYATPENWRVLADQLFSLYPECDELFLEFINRNAPPSALAGTVNLLTRVQEYVNEKKKEHRVKSAAQSFGNLSSLSYFVRFCQRSNFEEFVKKLACATVIEPKKDNVLGQLREQVLTQNVAHLSELVDKVIVLFRGRVEVHNMQVRTSTKTYTYAQARQILGCYTLNSNNIDILDILDMCPYFQAKVQPLSNVKLFLEQLTTSKYAISGVRRNLTQQELYLCYRDWCRELGIGNFVTEVDFCWQSTVPLIENGTKFSTYCLGGIQWKS